jgi:phage terminase large subunit GpA-like protein
VDVSVGGKKLRRGLKLYAVTVGIAKQEIYQNLRKQAMVAEDGVTVVYPPGYLHLPKVDAEFLQQLCAEQLVTRRDRNGYPKREWQKLRERNEAIDIFCYCRAAAAAAGLDRFEERHWRELERSLGIADAPDPPRMATATSHDEAIGDGGLSTSARPSRRRVVKSRWLHR